MIILGLGSNFGDRPANLRKAVQALRSGAFRSILRVRAVSPLYESDAMLPESASPGWDQPYLNLAVLAEWAGDPVEPPRLLEEIKSLELKLGRRDRGRWAPREIDIDILLIQSLVFRSAGLEIPHPGLKSRPFALLPVADLLPDWRFPVAGPDRGRSARELSASWRHGNPARVPYHTRRAAIPLAETVGILNVTPDSFSGDGILGSPDRLLDRARNLLQSGASVLDIGAESTRPGAGRVEPREEWLRLGSVLKVLGEGLGPDCRSIKVSIDTRHATVARRALRQRALPVAWVNDVTGGQDPAIRKVVADSGAELVFMHSLGLPPSRQRTLSFDRDPIEEILEWAQGRIADLGRSGIPPERLIFDPGIGFGKTPEQSMLLLREAGRFHELGVRILIGHSRKSFLKRWDPRPGRPASERDPETALLSCHLAAAGVDYLRVHEVDLNQRALAFFSLMEGVSRC